MSSKVTRLTKPKYLAKQVVTMRAAVAATTKAAVTMTAVAVAAVVVAAAAKVEVAKQAVVQRVEKKVKTLEILLKKNPTRTTTISLSLKKKAKLLSIEAQN